MIKILFKFDPSPISPIKPWLARKISKVWFLILWWRRGASTSWLWMWMGRLFSSIWTSRKSALIPNMISLKNFCLPTQRLSFPILWNCCWVRQRFAGIWCLSILWLSKVDFLRFGVSFRLDAENQKLFGLLKPLMKELDHIILQHAKKSAPSIRALWLLQDF